MQRPTRSTIRSSLHARTRRLATISSLQGCNSSHSTLGLQKQGY